MDLAEDFRDVLEITYSYYTDEPTIYSASQELTLIHLLLGNEKMDSS